MSYTLEQKRDALAKGELWWRRPLSQLLGEWEKFPYYSASPHINHPRARYHIGPTAPTPSRVLSELEGDLLEALKGLHERLTKSVQIGLTAEEAYDSFYQDVVQSAISKATP